MIIGWQSPVAPHTYIGLGSVQNWITAPGGVATGPYFVAVSQAYVSGQESSDTYTAFPAAIGTYTPGPVAAEGCPQ